MVKYDEIDDSSCSGGKLIKKLSKIEKLSKSPKNFKNLKNLKKLLVQKNVY